MAPTVTTLSKSSPKLAGEINSASTAGKSKSNAVSCPAGITNKISDFFEKIFRYVLFPNREKPGIGLAKLILMIFTPLFNKPSTVEPKPKSVNPDNGFFPSFKL